MTPLDSTQLKQAFLNTFMAHVLIGNPEVSRLARAEEPLRLRDAVDPEWMELKDIYSIVQAGLAGQTEVTEGIDAKTAERRTFFTGSPA
jgi:hypothetical protein